MFKPPRRQQAKLIHALTEARKRANLTQRELSEKIGAADSFVGKFESGIGELGFHEFAALAKATGNDPVELARSIWDPDEATD